jgi:hypothetical protein
MDYLACQDEFFVNDPLDFKESYEHALEFAFHLSHAYLINGRLSITLFLALHKI